MNPRFTPPVVCVHSGRCAVLSTRVLGVPASAVRRAIQSDPDAGEHGGDWFTTTNFGSVTVTARGVVLVEISDDPSTLRDANQNCEPEWREWSDERLIARKWENELYDDVMLVARMAADYVK